MYVICNFEFHKLSENGILILQFLIPLVQGAHNYVVWLPL